MLNKFLFILNLLSVMMLISMNPSLAGRNSSKELGPEEAKSRYSNATTVREKMDAYKELRRFEPEDLWKTEVELARLLVSLKTEESCKMAITLFGRAMLSSCDPADDGLGINDFLNVLDPYLSMKGKITLLNGYAAALNRKDVKEINLKTFELLELLNDLPEGYESLFLFSEEHLEGIDPKEHVFFLRRLVEQKKVRNPAVLDSYLYSMKNRTKGIPLPVDDVVGLYKAMFTEDRFKFQIDHIDSYTTYCMKNKRDLDNRDLLVEVLEDGEVDAETTLRYQFALAVSYSNLHDYKNAVLIYDKFIPSLTDEDLKREFQWILYVDLHKLGDTERAKELLQNMNHSSLSHLTEQRDNRKDRQRRHYVDAIKFQLAQAKEVTKKTTQEKGRDNEKERESAPVLAGEEIGDSFLPGKQDSTAHKSDENTNGVKQKTHKMANLNLNKKPDKSRKKGKKEEKPVKKTVVRKTAEELLNGTPYKTLVQIFRVFVGEMKAVSCKITVEEVGHLFECLGHRFDKSRGKGGHSMIICNAGEEEGEDVPRKAFTFGSKKKVNPAAIVDIASFLLEYRIYPKQFEDELISNDLL